MCGGRVVNMIMNRFDVNNLGGIHMVRKQNQLHKFFQQVLDDRLQSRYGKGMIKPRHDQKCACKVHHPFTGMAFTCPCVCRDDKDCVLLCYLGIANCGVLHDQSPSSNSRVIRNNAGAVEKKLLVTSAKKRPKTKSGAH